MTGYGRGESVQHGFKVTVEISSVNRKVSEVTVGLPRELEVLEARVRDEIQRQVSRGKLTVRVGLQAGRDFGPIQVRLNEPLARGYARALRRLAKDMQLAGPVTLELVARAPGVLESDAQPGAAEDYWPAVKKALDQAMATLLRMREREGAHLAKDLAARITAMRQATARIQQRAPQVLKRYRAQLLERLREAGLATPAFEDERLLKEVVYFADRSSIAEELTRLQSHYQQFDDCRQSSQPVGRTLDFLAQEMNREINTLGAKANDSRISREVVRLKTALEQFREQAMNVE